MLGEQQKGPSGLQGGCALGLIVVGSSPDSESLPQTQLSTDGPVGPSFPTF